jgi:unsaturated rhamnogalacturonyl hydrolase
MRAAPARVERTPLPHLMNFHALGFFRGAVRWTALILSVASPLCAQLPSRQSVLSVVSKVNDAWIQAHPTAGNLTNNWNGAAYMIGSVAAYDVTANANYLNYTLSWANAYGYQLLNGDTTRNADNQAAGQVYFRHYELLGDSTRLAHITASVHAMVTSSTSSDWTWCDALHMAMPVFASLGQQYADPAYAAKMYSLYNYCKRSVGGSGLYNATDHLWARDATFLTGGSGQIYWSRGNAWAFVAHARVLETLPTSDSHYLEYLSTFRDMAAKLLTLQQADGFWHADLTHPATYPTPETSGTSGFLFGLAWGVRSGALDSATYLPAVTKAWNGLATTAVHSDGFLGYVQGTGKQPSDHQPVTTNDTADFGVGLFLMAAAEVAKLAPDQATTATPTFSPAGDTYASPVSVTLSSATAGATVRYTTDGSAPSTTAGTIYSGPISIARTTTLKAIAYSSGLAPSPVATATYTVSSTPPPTVKLEAENLSYTATGAPAQLTRDRNLSNRYLVSLNASSVGPTIDFVTASIPAGTYQLRLAYKGLSSRGVCSIKVDGTQIGTALDQYSSAQTYPVATLGTVTFASAGTHTLRLTVTGRNAASSGYSVSADYFTLVGQ